MKTDKHEIFGLACQIQDDILKLQLADEAAVAALQATVTKLQRALTQPPAAALRQRFHTVENLCIIAAEEMGILDTLASNKGKSCTASELATATGYDLVMISRIMGVITAIGFADEIGYQTYHANPVTLVQNSPGGRGGLIVSNDFMFALAGQIRTYFRQRKPCALEDTVPAYDFATHESIWTTLRRNPEWKAGFDNAMTGRQKLYSTPWHTKFPVADHMAKVAETRDAAYMPTIVDIGGNQGVDLQRIADAYPHLDCKLILQDLPETIDGIPHGSLSTRVEPTRYDFFTPQPVQGATIYYLKSVLHDWDDTSSRRILSNTAEAMDASSRLLINDIVLADTNEAVDRADMDVLMLFISNGMERTKTQWEELLASVSPPLSVVKVWSVSHDPQSVIEARLAD